MNKRYRLEVFAIAAVTFSGIVLALFRANAVAPSFHGLHPLEAIGKGWYEAIPLAVYGCLLGACAVRCLLCWPIWCGAAAGLSIGLACGSTYPWRTIVIAMFVIAIIGELMVQRYEEWRGPSTAWTEFQWGSIFGIAAWYGVKNGFLAALALGIAIYAAQEIGWRIGLLIDIIFEQLALRMLK